jgi:chromate transporter
MTSRQAACGESPAGPAGTWPETLAVFLKLGLTSFGGPIAHLGYFRDELVVRRRWLADSTYADLVALCQFLPGPASSQVGIAIGLTRAGWPGALAAWLGFTLPSALAMILFAYGVDAFADDVAAGWLRGLKVVAVAVVANAVWGMARTLSADRERATLTVVAAAIVLFWPGALGQVGAILLGAVVGILFLGGAAGEGGGQLAVPIRRGVAVLCLGLFFALLIGLPILVATTDNMAVRFFDSFYRAGSLVFGGGHVVLPLLQAEVVDPGWVTRDAFVAGYGAAQAVPGPLFTFAAYLGTVMIPEPDGAVGGMLCLLAIFLPSFLLVIGVLPFWDGLRRRPQAQAALRGVNAAVVGLLLAALYDPVWTSGIRTPADFALAATALLLLAFWQLPPWLVVIVTALAGAGLVAVGY